MWCMDDEVICHEPLDLSAYYIHLSTIVIRHAQVANIVAMN